jgi:hypothetical protein
VAHSVFCVLGLQGTYHGTSAALEFAVMGLQVEHIIVLGHRHCGGIRALMTRSDFNSDFIGSWMKIGMSARERTLKLMAGKPITDQCHFCEQVKSLLPNCLSPSNLALQYLSSELDRERCCTQCNKFCMHRNP